MIIQQQGKRGAWPTKAAGASVKVFQLGDTWVAEFTAINQRTGDPEIWRVVMTMNEVKLLCEAIVKQG